MSRYADIDKLWEEIDNEDIYTDFESACIFKMVREKINNTPIADVEEVRHGKWVKFETDREYCSICHEVRPYYFKETFVNRYAEQKKLSLINWECPYCPNCGAKMDKETKE